jgi:hypothetical protein
MNLTESDNGAVVHFCEHGDEISGSLKDNFLNS